jgi:hypothetical protein
MAFPCPYCAHSITIKSAKPGKFKPKCPKCSQVFLLTVSEGQNSAPIAQKLQSDGGAPAPAKQKAVDIERTVAPPADDDVTQMTGAFENKQPPADDDATQVTGMFAEKPQQKDDDATQVTGAFEEGGKIKSGPVRAPARRTGQDAGGRQGDQG